MQKKTLITAIIISVLTVGIGIMAYLLIHQKQKNEEYIELAELDKKELENQYTEFNLQYQELQKSITNDSLIAQIEVERRHTQQLLQELKDTKATDAAEIARLKKEIESLRKVLRTYVAQVDSLMRINQDLTEENKNIRAQYKEEERQGNTEGKRCETDCLRIHYLKERRHTEWRKNCVCTHNEARQHHPAERWRHIQV